MLRRLWLVLSVAWAVLIIGLRLADPSASPAAWLVAVAPFIAGVVLWPLARWVRTGSSRRSYSE